MKINCGPKYKPLTAKQLANFHRSKLAANAWRAKRKHLTIWHRHFAWYPVRISDNDCRWLQWVERKKEYFSGISHMVRTVYYRLVPLNRLILSL